MPSVYGISTNAMSARASICARIRAWSSTEQGFLLRLTVLEFEYRLRVDSGAGKA